MPYREFGLVKENLAAQATPAVANHTANCSEFGFVTRFNGYVSTSWPAHRYGVKARIGGALLDLCTQPRSGEGSGSFAWVGIFGPQTSQLNIVQVGYGTCYGPLIPAAPECDPNLDRDFYAWGHDSFAPGCEGRGNLEPTPHFYSGFSAGNDYSVEEDANGTYTVRSYNSATFIGTNLICWTNQYVGVYTESMDYGDALGGSNATRLVFSLERFKTTPNEAWRILPSLCNSKLGPGSPSMAVFGCQVVGATIQLWTSR